MSDVATEMQSMQSQVARGIMRWITYCSFAAIAGCASDCPSIISTGSRSFACQAGFAGALITAPIWMPVVSAHEAAKEASAKKRAESVEAFRQSVQAGDIDAVKECLSDCRQIEGDDARAELRLVAAQRSIEIENGNTAVETQSTLAFVVRGLLMRAAYWQKTTDWAAIDANLPATGRLDQLGQVPASIRQDYYRGLDWRDEIIFYRIVAALRPQTDDAARAWFRTCRQSVAGMAPHDHEVQNNYVCELAYRRFFTGKNPPADLRALWRGSDNLENCEKGQGLKMVMPNGRPLANLTIRVSTAEGKSIWIGTTDAEGEAGICKKNLPENSDISFGGYQ